jgi:uncharacterized protein with LGFP repeats
MSAIDEKYNSLLSRDIDLGAATTDEILAADGLGSTRSYANGDIYYRPELGAFEVQGAILTRYIDLGAEQSSLGYPIADEEDYSADEATIGRQNFEFGNITRTRTNGAVEYYNKASSDDNQSNDISDIWSGDDQSSDDTLETETSNKFIWW